MKRCGFVIIAGSFFFPRFFFFSQNLERGRFAPKPGNQHKCKEIKEKKNSRARCKAPRRVLRANFTPLYLQMNEPLTRARANSFNDEQSSGKSKLLGFLMSVRGFLFLVENIRTERDYRIFFDTTSLLCMPQSLCSRSPPSSMDNFASPLVSILE